MNVNIYGKMAKVETLDEASQKIRKFIEDKLIGGNRWYSKKNTGNVYDNNKLIAYISYNGRIWQSGSKYFDEIAEA